MTSEPSETSSRCAAVAVVSAYPPCDFNLGPPTALLHQLLKHRPAHIDADLFYFSHGIDSALRERYEAALRDLRLRSATPIPPPSRLLRALHHVRTANLRRLPAGLAQFPVRARVVRAVQRGSYDLVWFYPIAMLAWAEAIRHPRMAATGPDSSSLHFERLIRFGKWNRARRVLLEGGQLLRNERLEKAWQRTGAVLHFVGRADARKFLEVTGEDARAFYSVHPLQDHGTVEAPLDRAAGQLSVLITGLANSVYAGDLLYRLTDALAARAPDLAGVFRFTFVGRYYDGFAERLRAAGFEVRHTPWVEDYGRELTAHQIQIFPLAVGTGTKSKVLHAMATGLLAVGTWVAFENVEAEPGRDCVLIRDMEEMPDILRNVAADRAGHAGMAERGRSRVRAGHAPERAASDFWGRALGRVRCAPISDAEGSA
jgi:hypothetical protein